MHVFISEQDRKDKQVMREKIESLEQEELILRAKLDGVIEYKHKIQAIYDKDYIIERLSLKGIEVEGEKIEIAYADGTRFGVTMGMDGSWGHQYLRVHLMLKNGKGWFQESSLISANEIDAVRKTSADIPDSPLINNKQKFQLS